MHQGALHATAQPSSKPRGRGRPLTAWNCRQCCTFSQRPNARAIQFYCFTRPLKFLEFLDLFFPKRFLTCGQPSRATVSSM